MTSIQGLFQESPTFWKHVSEVATTPAKTALVSFTETGCNRLIPVNDTSAYVTQAGCNRFDTSAYAWQKIDTEIEIDTTSTHAWMLISILFISRVMFPRITYLPSRRWRHYVGSSCDIFAYKSTGADAEKAIGLNKASNIFGQYLTYIFSSGKYWKHI